MSAAAALALFHAAVSDPGAVAARTRRAGGQVVWMLGNDLPYELPDAFGYHPIRLVPDAATDRSAVDAIVGADTLSWRGRALLAAVLALPSEDAVLISHADSEQPQIFATLRELARIGAIRVPRVHFLDLLTIDRASTRRYNRCRLEQAAAWFAAGEPVNVDPLAGAILAGAGRRALLRTVLARRGDAGLSGHDAHAVIAGLAVLPAEDGTDAMHALLAGAVVPRGSGDRVLLSGSDLEDIAVVAAIERDGMRVVAEDHGWGGDRALRDLAAHGCPLDALAAAALTPSSGPFASAAGRAAAIVRRAAALGVDRVVHVVVRGDESAPWEVAAIRRAIAPTSVTLIERGDLIVSAAAEPVWVDPPRPQPRARSRKSLASVALFGTYQREWFADVRAASAGGAPFAVVNANAPQEILRALDIPFVVNQWWASIVAAKQQSSRYAALLASHDLPVAVEAYSAQGIAAAYDTDAALAPWGGLPRPDVLAEVSTTDATPKLFEAWAHATGARLQRYERSIESRWEITVDWWKSLPDRWDELLEPERLDLFEAELRAAVAELETVAGRPLDPARLAEVMDLVNQQQEYYAATRDLIARTVPAPVSIVDTMPATMVPQWHRGTVWARDAARAFHNEVAARVVAGDGACPGERIRLMFVGRGLWGDMGFYQRWEESHGAVFVCSMYLSLAADGYIRRHDRGRDPLRALAARFVTMGDELRMPTWAGAWHVKEARLHQCDGAVALADADPLVLHALNAARIPVLELGMDNFSRNSLMEADLDARVAAFLECPAVAENVVRRQRPYKSPMHVRSDL